MFRQFKSKYVWHHMNDTLRSWKYLNFTEKMCKWLLISLKLSERRYSECTKHLCKTNRVYEKCFACIHHLPDCNLGDQIIAILLCKHYFFCLFEKVIRWTTGLVWRPSSPCQSPKITSVITSLGHGWLGNFLHDRGNMQQFPNGVVCDM